MKFNTVAFIVLLGVTIFLLIGFTQISHGYFKAIGHKPYPTHRQPAAATIGGVNLPAGFTRVGVPKGSFAEWLRNFPLRTNNTVYLYNDQPIENQSLHYAVLDISTGNKDLQQCADAIMRLRAEYYLSKKEYGNIVFGEGKETLRFADVIRHAGVTEENIRPSFTSFMEKVFVNCGTYTIDAMSSPVLLSTMQPGDMFVKAGSPGHAMVVVDVATNPGGKKIYMLAQSYMPAQDVHIVINPNNPAISPWYEVSEGAEINTPGWVFTPAHLRRWK